MFFGMLRPILACLSVFIMLLIIKFTDQSFQVYAIFVPIVFIVSYNILHINCRSWLMYIGLKFGKCSLSLLSNIKILIPILEYIGFFVVMAFFIAYVLVFKSGFISNSFIGMNDKDILLYVFVFLFSIAFSRFGIIFLFYSLITKCSLAFYLRI